MDISDWRKKIDEIDRSLVKLLNERARCVVEIGEIKRQNSLPIHEPNREQEVLRQALEANQGPLASEAIQRIFERIVAEGRALQHRLFQQTLMELDEARDWLLAIGRKTARERVASLLHMIARHVPDNSPDAARLRSAVTFDLPLTRADMADFLGLTIETVSRQITRLRQDGIIIVEANRRISIPDIERLAELAEG